MVFEDYWVEVEKQKVLSRMAIEQLPSSLSESSKKQLMKLRPVKAAELLCAVIEEVNRGSVESVDCLIKKRL